MFYLLLAIFSLLLIFHLLIRYRRFGRLLHKIPGPPLLPILGNLLELNVSTDKLFNVMREILKQYNHPVIKVSVVNCAFVAIQNPDDLEILLSSPKTINKNYIYNYMHPWLKTGLLTSTGDKWRERRKMLTKAFHFQILKKYMIVASEQSEKFIDKLKQKSNEIVEDIMPMCLKITLDIICESVCGVKLDNLDSEEVKEYREAIHDFGTVVSERAVQPYIFDWMMCPLLRLGRMRKNALRVLHKFTDKVLENKMQDCTQNGNKYLQSRNHNANDDNDELIGSNRKLAMLDLLLSAEKQGLINREGIKEELDTFIFEGHDTTGMALTFTILMLAENKEAQHKARNEVLNIMNETEENILETIIKNCSYLDRCIKETLRLYPSVPIIFRNLTEDLQLKNYLLPAGVDVTCYIFDFHRNPKWWPHPEKFDPDRFLPENCVNRHPFSYLPFSAGPRNCIGQKFAMMELKSLVARILLNFELESIDRSADIKFKTSLILTPTKPIRIKFIKIDKYN